MDEDTATLAWLQQNPDYRLVHAAAGWTQGVSYGCHPEHGDVVHLLNAALVAFKATADYAALCERYPRVPCDYSAATYTNLKTVQAPEIATHPSARADVVIGAGWGLADHSHLRFGVLGGFDIELTQAVCAHIGKRCAVVPAPWQAAWCASAVPHLLPVLIHPSLALACTSALPCHVRAVPAPTPYPSQHHGSPSHPSVWSKMA